MLTKITNIFLIAIYSRNGLDQIIQIQKYQVIENLQKV
jgi:hypothetical protein